MATFLNLFWPVVLIIIGYLLRGWGESKREDRSIGSHIDALGMEIRFCGKLAAAYASDGVEAPLYRLPSTFYQLAVPELLRVGLLTGDETDALQKFYGQAEQVNRGLDNIDGLIRSDPDVHGRGLIPDERNRLEKKVNDMRAQGLAGDASELYRGAVASQFATFNRWQRSSPWRRFNRRYVRPLRERLVKLWRSG